MAAILIFGFFSVLLTVVTADFEYSADIVTTLPDYESLSKNEKGSFNYDLINPDGEVRLRRANTKVSVKEIVADASCAKFSEIFYAGLHFELESRYTSQSPGIRSRENGETKTQSIYYLTEIDFDIQHNGQNDPFMRLIFKYIDPNSKETVGVVTYPFKPPKNEVDKHSKDFQVPQVDPPISLKQSTPETKDTQRQNFIGNMLLMRDIKEKAKRMGRTRKRLASRFTEWYLVGPIIIEEEAYNKILELYHG